MVGVKMLRAALLATLAGLSIARSIPGLPQTFRVRNEKRALLQDIVTFDKDSIFVRGERVLLYSGEFHPFRLPVPSLWLDIFQKIKSLGYNSVSFYTDWALLEGKQGEFIAEGIFNFDDFFAAASQAGIYLLARPGPYINAEVSGGGFPGWLQRSTGRLRTADPVYLTASDNYAHSMAAIIAKAQITNGGPVILVQPENEYSGADPGVPFPDPVYFQYVEDQLRDAGIVVPLISNDNYPHGYNAPGQNASVDIYGYDNYPLGFDCANPGTWPVNGLPTNFYRLHEQQSPSTPNSIPEHQGGSFDPWGGNGFTKCRELVNYEFQRVFYKNIFSFGIKFFNLYMTYGGTNWGNIGHPGGYTSYDYGSVIAEDRTVADEKYSDAKLEANLLRANPAYLTAIPQDNSKAAGAFTGDASVFTTQLLGNTTNFYIVRHSDYTTRNSVQYSITVPTSQGNITIPQAGGKLTLSGRDSKVHVTDYDVAGTNLLYSSAEVFTYKKYADKTVLVLYGGPGETHEFALQADGDVVTIEGPAPALSTANSATIVNFPTSANRTILQVGDNLFVYLLDRNTAYNFWTLDLPTGLSAGDPNAGIKDAAIVYGGYLMRTAAVDGTTFSLTGDINATTNVEVIGGAPAGLTTFNFNNASVPFTQSTSGVVSACLEYAPPALNIPDLSTITWRAIDSLPEVQPDYDDSLWTEATLTMSNNTERNLTTPTSLYGSDYGYSYGNLVFRGRFIASGNDTTLQISTQGGSAFGVSVWLGTTLLGSYPGIDKAASANQTLNLPTLTAGQEYIITVLTDNMGLDENYSVGSSEMKSPRGILNYVLTGRPQTDVTWKLTGNLGGEDYRDRARGPLNEGGLFVERQGYHLPGAPTDGAAWSDSTGPSGEGIAQSGVRFFAATFDLDIPVGIDVPLALSFSNSTSGNGSTGVGGALATAYRCQVYVNGYQFGKYVHNVGPQDVFPVPQGIWNYGGSNYLGVSLWALEAGGAKVEDFKIVAGVPVVSGYGAVANSPMDGFVQREGAY